MKTVASPLSPRTATDLMAALSLSPALGPASPLSVRPLSITPPTTRLDEPPHLSQRTRALACNEARQLALLLTQHLWPVRNSSKALMSESIALAERLHEAGVRWDRHRRVMGLHLRGVWEEGQRLKGVSVGGMGGMDLYVQGSFLTVADDPHPLDPMPLPLEVKPECIAALPKLTLQAGLALTLPAFAHLEQPQSQSQSQSHSQGHWHHWHHGYDAAAGFTCTEQVGLVPPPSPAPSIGWCTSASTAASPRTTSAARKSKSRERKRAIGLSIKIDASPGTTNYNTAAVAVAAARAAGTAARRGGRLGPRAEAGAGAVVTTGPGFGAAETTAAAAGHQRRQRLKRLVHLTSNKDQDNAGPRRISWGGWEMR